MSILKTLESRLTVLQPVEEGSDLVSMTIENGQDGNPAMVFLYEDGQAVEMPVYGDHGIVCYIDAVTGGVIAYGTTTSDAAADMGFDFGNPADLAAKGVLAVTNLQDRDPEIIAMCLEGAVVLPAMRYAMDRADKGRTLYVHPEHRTPIDHAVESDMAASMLLAAV